MLKRHRLDNWEMLAVAQCLAREIALGHVNAKHGRELYDKLTAAKEIVVTYDEKEPESLMKSHIEQIRRGRMS